MQAFGTIDSLAQLEDNTVGKGGTGRGRETGKIKVDTGKLTYTHTLTHTLTASKTVKM